MTALYLLAAEYRDAALRLADLDLDPQTVADTLDGMSGALEEKAQAVAFVIRARKADAAAMREWATAAHARADREDARTAELLDYLRRHLESCGIQRIDGPGISIGWRKSSAVVIDEPGLLPAEYMRQPDPPLPAPDKVRIAAAIKAGTEVAGAHIATRQHLTIR